MTLQKERHFERKLIFIGFGGRGTMWESTTPHPGHTNVVITTLVNFSTKSLEDCLDHVLS